MIEVRELSADAGGTCDWGGCDRPTVAERHDPEFGWLPVCELHGGRSGRQVSPGRGVCSGCGKERAVNVAGNMYKHDRGFATVCPGAGKPPEGGLVPRQSVSVEPSWWNLPQGKTSHAHVLLDGPAGTHAPAVCGAAPVWHGRGWEVERPGARRPRCVRCCRILDPDSVD